MLGAHVARSVRGRRPLPAGAVWALVASFLALDTAGSGGPADLHFATAGMLLALGTVLEAPPVVHRDEVTGLPASLELNKIIRRLPRHYALACVAIDEFTTYRDEHGPEVGKKLMRLVADNGRDPQLDGAEQEDEPADRPRDADGTCTGAHEKDHAQQRQEDAHPHDRQPHA